MKKVLFAVALMVLLLFTVSCQKPEQITISKYFQAMKAKDRDTMGAMAGEPFAIEFKSWKLIASDEPTTEDMPLSVLIKQMDELKKAKEEKIRQIQDLKDNSDTLKTTLSETRGSKKKTVQAQLDAVEKSIAEETNKFKELQMNQGALKAAVEYEKKLITMSTGINQNQDAYSGKVQSYKSTVRIVTAGGERDYYFLMRKYELLNPNTGKPLISRLVIDKAVPKE